VDILAELHPEMYATYTVKGLVTVNGKDAYWLEVVNKKGKKSAEYYDRASFLLVKQIDAGENGEPGAVTEFSDYQEVPGSNGYKMPYTRKIMGADMKVTSVLLNKGMADKEFE
jgi:zinc protease